MKRNHHDDYVYLYRHRGWLFWQQCAHCMKDFRREAGWRYLTGPWIGGAGRWKYLCCECAPNRMLASIRIIEIDNRRPVRPPPPPQPPRVNV